MVALVHGWALDPVIRGSAPLRVLYVVVGAVAVFAYGYDELIRRRREPQADYLVGRVERPTPGVLDVTLTPSTPAVLPVTGGLWTRAHWMRTFAKACLRRFRSGAFDQNPIGVTISFADLISRYRAGEPLVVLLARPDS